MMRVAEIEKIKTFIKMVEDLKAYSRQLSDDDDEMWEANFEAMEEIDCMAEHCDACLGIMKKVFK